MFITPFSDTIVPERLLGRCYVLFYKTFQNSLVKGINQEHVFVCEHKYLGKPKYFAKIKVFLIIFGKL